MQSSSNSLINKVKIPVAIATLALVSLVAVPAVNAAPLENTDLQVTSSSANGGDANKSTLRVVTADQFENVGVGAANASRDEDGSSSNNAAQLEVTDYAENISANGVSQTSDSDGSSNTITGNLTSADYLENVAGNSQASNVSDDGESSALGFSGVSNDYGKSGHLEATSITSDADEVMNQTIRFGFED